jgi:hypothetical protein
MSLPDRTVAGILYSVLRLFGRLALFLESIRASGFLLLELDWSFHAAQTDTPVATIGTIPRSDVGAELILGIGHLRRPGLKRALCFRF